MAKKTITPAVIENELPTELITIAAQSEMALPEAQAIGAMFAPHMLKVNELTEMINAIPTENPSVKDAALARKLRLELVSSRGKNGLLEVHKKAKESILVRGRLIDSYKNVVEDSSKIAELRAEGIEKFSENQERIRLDKVESARLDRLKELGGEPKYGVNIRLMDDETFEQYFNNEKLLFDAQERERIEAEKREIEIRDLVKNRTKQLVDAGAKFDGETFTAGTINVTLASLNEITVPIFTLTVKNVKAEVTKQLAEQKKRDTELAAFKKAEDEKKALLLSRFNLRGAELAKVGFAFIPSTKLFIQGDNAHASIPSSAIVNMEDKQWNEYLKPVVDAVNEYKKQRELSGKLMYDAGARLSSIGFELIKDGFQNKELDWFIPNNQLDSFKTPVELDDYIAQQQLQHAKLTQAKVDAENVKAEKALELERSKKAAALLLAPDQDQVKAFYAQFKDFKFPSLKSDAGKAMETKINTALDDLRKLIINESKTLL